MDLALGPGAVVLDRFHLDRLLGEGGMGAVWEATSRDDGQRVALKFLKRAGELSHRRFRREARASMSVEHPNVRRVLDIAELPGGEPVIVMEFLTGESLAGRLAREGRLPLPVLATLVAQVASAIGAAHAAGVIHRDLKPENIFLCDGTEAHAKVLDFGIAKFVHGGDAVLTTGLTDSGSMLGTPCYMSPEQAFDVKNVDHRTDVWSLGIVIYEALSGVLPTRGETLGQVFRFLASGDFVPLHTLVPGLPDDVASLVHRMLSRAPEERPADLHEVGAAFGAHGELPAARLQTPVRSRAPEISAHARNTAVDAHARTEEEPLLVSVDRENPASLSPRSAREWRPWAVGLAAVLLGGAGWWATSRSELAPPEGPSTLAARPVLEGEAPPEQASSRAAFPEPAPSTSAVSPPFAPMDTAAQARRAASPTTPKPRPASAALPSVAPATASPPPVPAAPSPPASAALPRNDLAF